MLSEGTGNHQCQSSVWRRAFELPQTKDTDKSSWQPSLSHPPWPNPLHPLQASMTLLAATLQQLLAACIRVSMVCAKAGYD